MSIPCCKNGDCMNDAVFGSIFCDDHRECGVAGCSGPMVERGYCRDHADVTRHLVPAGRAPLGVMPEWRWRELRVLELLDAAKRMVGHDHERVRQYLKEVHRTLPHKSEDDRLMGDLKE